MHFNDRDTIIALTPLWKGERLPDGRPKVADKYLDALCGMTLEEVWKPIFVLGYEHQFVGGGEAPLHALHDDGRKLVGRAVTCTYCPTRPDLHEVQFGRGAEDGLVGNYNQWVIDHLYERDVVVCDMYDKIYKGTFLGGNLTTALHNRTKTGGAVCLPGDVVFGAGGGVLFIPSHLVADVVEGAAKTHVKDDFGFEMICQGRFTTAQIDKNTWSEDMLDLLLDWIKTDPRGEAYRDLDWSKEYDLARNGDPNDTQTAL